MQMILRLHAGHNPETIRNYIIALATEQSTKIKDILNTQTHSGSTALMYIFKKPTSFSLFGKSYECPSFISTNGEIMNENIRDLVTSLLSYGADPDITDNSGKTIYDYARLCGESIGTELHSLVDDLKATQGVRKISNNAYSAALKEAVEHQPTFNPRGFRKTIGQSGASRRKKSKKYRKTLRQRGGLPQPGRSTVAGVLPPALPPVNLVRAAEVAALQKPMSTDPVNVLLLKIGETQSQSELNTLLDAHSTDSILDNPRIQAHIAWKMGKLAQQAGYRRRTRRRHF
jgi:AraC-like DNA-binding protein